MHFTASTIPIGLLTLYLWHRSKGKALPVVMFLSVFQAASLVNIGSGIGVQPTFLVMMLMIGKHLLKYRSGSARTELKPSRWTLIVMIIFTAYAVGSAFINPFLFTGVLVTHPRIGSDQPLYWETGHLSQVLYLILCVGLYIITAYKSSPREVGMATRWYVGGCLTAAIIGIYQFASTMTGLPFPTDVFHSNPSYVMYEAYDIGSFTRIDSTFTEASAAAIALAVGLAIASWDILSGTIRMRDVATCATLLIAILMTFSSTGTACLVFFFAVAALRFFFHWKKTQRGPIAKLLLLAPLAAGFLSLFVLATPRAYVMNVFDATILQKKESTSFRDRSSVNDSALKTAKDTFWLGAGFGICRASGLIPTVLANIGWPGLSLLCLLAFGCFAPLLERRVWLVQHQAVLFGLACYLVSAVLSSPELTQPLLWFLVAICLRFKEASNPVYISKLRLRAQIYAQTLSQGRDWASEGVS